MCVGPRPEKISDWNLKVLSMSVQRAQVWRGHRQLVQVLGQQPFWGGVSSDGFIENFLYPAFSGAKRRILKLNKQRKDKET
jgi:hypothetical protein